MSQRPKFVKIDNLKSEKYFLWLWWNPEKRTYTPTFLEKDKNPEDIPLAQLANRSFTGYMNDQHPEPRTFLEFIRNTVSELEPTDELVLQLLEAREAMAGAPA